MRRFVVSLIILLAVASNALAQQFTVKGFLTDLFFPEIKEMQVQLESMEAKLDEFMKYQHTMNQSTYTASVSAYNIAFGNDHASGGVHGIWECPFP